VANDYCTLAQVKAELKISDAADDSLLNIAISAASQQIDGYCGRRFWQDPAVVVRDYHPESPVVCEVDDISTATGLIVAIDLLGYGVYDTTLTLNTDFILEPKNAAAAVPAWPYEELHIVPFGQNYFPHTMRPGVRVTAKYGWPAVPDGVTKACLIQAIDLYKAKDAVFGIAGSNDYGQLRVSSGMNRLATALLGSYRKPAIG
jgi:hypothetical protein